MFFDYTDLSYEDSKILLTILKKEAELKKQEKANDWNAVVSAISTYLSKHGNIKISIGGSSPVTLTNIEAFNCPGKIVG